MVNSENLIICRSALRITALCLMVSLSLTAAVNADALLTVIVLDSGSGEPINTRCNVMDSLGIGACPADPPCLYYTFGEGFFYSDGEFTVSVPTGPTLIRLSRGPEYHLFETTLTVSGDTTVTCLMERMIDMRGAGWFSGDTHTHINHIGGYYELLPSHAHLLGLAEDLHFVNCLDNDFHFTGAADVVSTAECTVYMSEEWRSFIYGHFSIPGLKSLVVPVWGAWGDLPCDVADSVHAQDGPLFISAHPVSTYDFDFLEDWPGTGLARGVPIDAIHGRIDAFEVMCYSNINEGVELDMWYRLLDCGFMIPPCAGTDAAVNRFFDRPMGGFRTYVDCGETPADIYEWLGKIASGRTFVTNGPLFREFVVNGSLEAGDSLYLGSGAHPFFVDIDVECSFPLERVEIVVNGGVVDALTPGGDPKRITGRSNFYISGSSWIAARARGTAADWFTMGDELFAHTGAVYAHINGEHVLRWNAALYFTEWIDSLIALADEKGEWLSQEDSVYVYTELNAARDWYADLAGTSTGTEDPQAGDVPSAPYVSVYPNPFSSTVKIRLEAGGKSADLLTYESMRTASVQSPADVRIYDVSGRLVRKLKSGNFESGPYEVEWDGTRDDGSKASSGIYFCQVRAGGYSARAKVLLIR